MAKRYVATTTECKRILKVLFEAYLNKDNEVDKKKLKFMTGVNHFYKFQDAIQFLSDVNAIKIVKKRNKNYYFIVNINVPYLIGYEKELNQEIEKELNYPQPL